jgi:DNA-binding MarR family transcriptional regulator
MATFNLNASPSHLLHRAQQIAANHSAEALKSAGITLRQFSLLAALDAHDGASQADLVGATGIDRSTLADMVGRMEKTGFVKRADSKLDARAKTLSITPKGKKTLDKARPAVQAADNALFAILPKAKQDALMSGLMGLVEEATTDEAPAKTVKTKPKAKAKPKARAESKAAPRKTKAAAPAKAEKSPSKAKAKKRR